ncbi:MAG: hypothetical protein DRI56_06780 [Chloroflexota bacterium]|nr:MAG: hypothetical protein DRI56_06780 [Chloroflexota bacterium]
MIKISSNLNYSKHRPRRSLFSVIFVLMLLGLAQMACNLGAVEGMGTQPRLETDTPIPTRKTPSLTPNLSPSPTPTESPTPLPISPTATTIPPRTLYKINANLDYAGHRLGVSQEVYYVNSSNHQLRELVFVVEPNRHAGAFELFDLTWGDGRSIEDYVFEGGILRLALLEPLVPGGGVSVKLAYALHIPQREGTFGYTKRQTNLGDWYPFVAPYNDERGWLAHEPNYYSHGTLGEHLVYESADFEVSLNLGEEAESVILAASASADVRDGVYYFQAQSARNFTFSASPEYVVREVEWNGVTIQSVFFAEDAVAGEAVLTIAQESLAIYGEVFTPYQHGSFTVVEALFPDGMEFDGLVYVGSEYYRSYNSTPYNYLTLITAHETAHQWWYGLVGNDQALEPWLDEILATYTEQIYLEHAYPYAAGWWFNFRVAAYKPKGWVNSTIYDFDGFRPYVNAVYLRGATFLSELRASMGDEAFFAFLAAYAKSNTHEIAEGDDFWALLEGHEALVAQYFK